MAEYINIRGQNVEVLASDPANPTIGQIWYNSTSNTLKGSSVSASAAWATGGNLSSARVYGASAGGANDALSIGGENTVTRIDLVEEYDGTVWTTATALPTATGTFNGAGIQTAALAFGGSATAVTASTYTYDGSTWSPTGSMNSARGAGGSGGIQTAAFMAGGSNFTTPTTFTATENFNGTSWTSSGNLSTGRRLQVGAGTQTAGLIAGGRVGTPPGTESSATEEYNGSSWTSGGSLNTARSYLSGFGIQTVAVAAGGVTPSATNAVEEYDGTSWTSGTNLPTTLFGHYASGIGGNGTSGIIFGGANPAQTAATQDYIAAGSQVTETITSS